MIAARLAAIALMAAAVATGLYFFTMHCGAVHGSPACGHASLPATAIAVAAFALDSAIVGAAASEGSARSALAVVCYAIALAACAPVVCWLSDRRGD